MPSNHRAVPYLCALVAELAYYHVPQFEIDAPKRAKLVVPSAAYRTIISAGLPTSVLQYLQEGDFTSFVAIDRRVVAVGVVADNKLFVGFRGTAFLFDWRINLRAPLIPVAGIGIPTFSNSWLWPGAGHLHRGFAEEAVRLSVRITEEVAKLGSGRFNEVYLSGHSLGGAVAAISENLLLTVGGLRPTHIFGAPRYADVAHCYSKFGAPPLQFKRDGDIVPAVPPKRLGYADHPSEYDTQGNQRPTLRDSLGAHFVWRASLFAARRLKPHFMEGYRGELGKACGAALADQQLTDHTKVQKAATK